MAGDAVQRITSAVEEEALLRVKGKLPAAEAVRDLVDSLCAHIGDCLGVIQIRILQAVPAVNLRDAERTDTVELVALLCQRQLRLTDALNGSNDPVPAGRGPGLKKDFRVLALKLRCDLEALAAEIAEVKVNHFRNNQVHIPVDSAVEGEIGPLGIDPIIGGIIHPDLQHVFVPECAV